MIRVGLPKGVVKYKSKLLAEKLCNCKLSNSQLSVQNGKYVFFFLKHRDIPKLIDTGYLDVGITSDEWIIESSSNNLTKVFSLNWCTTKIALITDDLNKFLRVCATEFTVIATTFIKKTPMKLINISGSSESLVPIIADCCIDCVETGTTLSENNLNIKEILMVSNMAFIMHHGFDLNNIYELYKLSPCRPSVGTNQE